MSSDYDVAVAGGGPAGSTAAALLAIEGRRVLVLEKDRFPRFHIGESLLPRSMPALERTGALEKIRSAGFLKKFGAEIASACGEKESRFFFKEGFRPEGDHAFQVPRAEFDKLLLDRAAEVGARVLEETPVTSVAFHPDRVDIQTGAGNFSAAYLLDCTGRNALVAAQRGLKSPYEDLHKMAVYAHYEDVPRPDGPEGTLTRMVRAHDHWFWMIPLSPTKMSIGVVMDTAAFRACRQPPEEVLRRCIERAPTMRERLASSRLCTPVHAAGDYSYKISSLAGERWLLAGDAAGFIDPVFSSGIFLAILGAEQAASAIISALDHPASRPAAFALYERRMCKVMKLYLGFVRSWYRQEFVETVLNPVDVLAIVPAVNAVLAGNVGESFSLAWRLALFRAIVAIQRFVPLCPRLNLRPHSL